MKKVVLVLDASYQCRPTITPESHALQDFENQHDDSHQFVKIHWFPGLFPDTSEHTRFYCLTV